MRRNKRNYFSTKTFVGFAAAAVFLLCGPALQEAEAWWDGNWKTRKLIQFDASSTGADIKADLTEVPMLVRLHPGNFSFSSAKEDGSDLRFISADDKTPLKYHIERYDPKDEIALIWVKVPRISGGSNQNPIWMYYGNASAQDGQDAAGTYDANQVAVFHLREQEGNPKDATASANHASSFSAKLGLPTVIGNGAQFGGADERMTLASSPSLNFSSGFTFSAWVRPIRSSKEAHIFTWDDGKQSVVIGIDQTRPYCSLSFGKEKIVVATKTETLTPGRWRHLAVTAAPNSRITLYLDGTEAASGELKGPVPEVSADLIFGSPSKGGGAFAGDLDEVQLSNAARPAEWIKGAFQGHGPEGMLTSVSLEEEIGGGGGDSLTIHLIKVIIRTITLDGWLIIAFLAIMGCACFVVFAEKLVTLRQANIGNGTFSKDFGSTDQPLSLLEKHRNLRYSPIYRIYSAGCGELTNWLERKGKSVEEKKGFSERALTGFRAALEKASMRESRKLSGGMFILNLGVAGGPFLGLLGTVWGVMNTFAGLAEASEANLQAIAPGVASALACTLAGLLVAIPALFGSIYITGHLKNLNADMHVFIEDFILKMEDERGHAP